MDIRRSVRTLDSTLRSFPRRKGRSVREDFADALDQLASDNKPADLNYALKQLARDLRTPRPQDARNPRR
ncbi:hypothetical protein EON81_24190 [bacterium]|nr:MAG: hypothetical protein EON81_24190 [bacterium]